MRLIESQSATQLGWAVAAIGDVNGDGRGDIAVGAPGTSVGGPSNVGRVYVIFGAASFPNGPFDLASLNGSNGVRIDVAGAGLGSPRFGAALAGAGDVNGDGLADFLIGTELGGSAAGRVFLILGRNTWPAQFDVGGLTGSLGGQLIGESVNDGFGRVLAGGGDVNNDGFDDLLLGAPQQGTGGRAYVVYGRSTWPASIAMNALGSGGAQFTPPAGGDRLGAAVALGPDLNNDGRDDLILGATGSDAPGASDVGRAYVLFGRPNTAPWTGSVSVDAETAGGTSGFRVRGAAAGDELGGVLAILGDVNDDGIPDFALGAPAADPSGANSGAVYVLYGRGSGFSAEINVATMTDADGFRLAGQAAGDGAGSHLSGGDSDGDGILDLCIGAPGWDAGAASNAGRVYLVRGSADPRPLDLGLSNVGGSLAGEIFAGSTAGYGAGACALAGKFFHPGRAALVLGALASGNGDVHVVLRGPERLFRNGFEP